MSSSKNTKKKENTKQKNFIVEGIAHFISVIFRQYPSLGRNDVYGGLVHSAGNAPTQPSYKGMLLLHQEW
jgi:hypothetical protein